MRICYVLDYPLSNTGGIVTSTVSQIKALEQAGHTVYLLHTRPVKGIRTLLVKPHFTIPVPGTPFMLPCVINTKNRRRVVSDLLRKNRIEFVCLQSELSLSWIAMSSAQSLGIPVIFTIHSIFWQVKTTLPKLVASLVRLGIVAVGRRRVRVNHTFDGNRLEQTLKSLTLSVADEVDGVISPSKHQAELLKTYAPEINIRVVPNPFFPSVNKPAVVLTKSITGPLRVTWIGRFTDEKRPFVFLEAVSHLDPKQFTCTMIGDGPLLPIAREAYDNLPNLKLHGELTNEEVVNAIDTAHIVVLTSYHFDNQPMVVAEAISRARPVLYCDERLRAEGLSTAGILTHDPSAAAFTKSLLSLEQNRHLFEKYSNASKQASTLFTPKHFASTMKKLLQSYDRS